MANDSWWNLLDQMVVVPFLGEDVTLFYRRDCISRAFGFGVGAEATARAIRFVNA